MNRNLYLRYTSILRCSEVVTRVYYGVEFVTQLAHGTMLYSLAILFILPNLYLPVILF